MTGASNAADLLETLRETREALDEGNLAEALQLLVRLREWETLDRDVDARVQMLRSGPEEANLEQLRGWIEDVIADHESNDAPVRDHATSGDSAEPETDVFANLEEVSEPDDEFSDTELVPAEGGREETNDAISDMFGDSIVDTDLASSAGEDEMVEEPPTSESDAVARTQSPGDSRDSEASGESTTTDASPSPPNPETSPPHSDEDDLGAHDLLGDMSFESEDEDGGPPGDFDPGDVASDGGTERATSDSNEHEVDDEAFEISFDDALAESSRSDEDASSGDRPDPTPRPDENVSPDEDFELSFDGDDSGGGDDSPAETPRPGDGEEDDRALELTFEDFEETERLSNDELEEANAPNHDAPPSPPDDAPSSDSDEAFDLSFRDEGDDQPTPVASESASPDDPEQPTSPTSEDDEPNFSFEDFDQTERTPRPSGMSDEPTQSGDATTSPPPNDEEDVEESFDLGLDSGDDTTDADGGDVDDLDLGFGDGASEGAEPEAPHLEEADEEAVSMSFDDLDGAEPGAGPGLGHGDAPGSTDTDDSEDEREAVELDIDLDSDGEGSSPSVEEGPVGDAESGADSGPLFEPGSSAEIAEGGLESREQTDDSDAQSDGEQARYRASHSSPELLDDDASGSVDDPDRTEASNEDAHSSDSVDDEFFDLADSISDESDGERESRNKTRQYDGDPLVELQQEIEASEKDSSDESASSNDPPTGTVEPSDSDTQIPSLQSGPVDDVPEASSEPADHLKSGAFRLLEEAEQLLESDNYESARDLVQSVLDRNPESDKARELLDEIEDEQSTNLADQLGSLEDVPTQNVAMNELDLSSADLDHRCGYVLSLIDGRITFEDILEISSMSRQETLELLVEMRREDIIDVR